MTLNEKDWKDLKEILTCALDEDLPYIDAMIRERKTGIPEPCLDTRPPAGG
jgi:hypothetical protein